MDNPTTITNPANIVAVIIAARRVGNRELERIAKDQLRDLFGVRLSFARDFEGKPKPQVAS